MFLSYGGDILQIEVNNRLFSVNLVIKRSNKRLYLRVKDGIVCITSPTRLSEKYIYSIIENNFNAIIKAMNEQIKIEDKIHYLGKKYNLVLTESNDNKVYISNDDFIVEYDDVKRIKNIIIKFYNSSLKDIMEQYSKSILDEFNLKDVCFKYKYVKGYFGECFYKKNIIVLSSKLAKYDVKYILSVLYHECAHFKYPNHQDEFYSYLESIYPNYRQVQKEMRKIKYKDAI